MLIKNNAVISPMVELWLDGLQHMRLVKADGWRNTREPIL